MKNRWRILPLILAVSICFTYVSFIENSFPLSVINSMKYEVVEEEVGQKKLEEEERKQKEEVESEALQSELQNGSRSSESSKLDYDFESLLEEMRSRDFVSSSLEPALQSLKLELLKELYGSTYEKLLESALQARPLESRPRPRSMQIIIATTWRSGSTFLEELLESHPGVYNIYEPLLPFGMRNFYHEDDFDSLEAQIIVQNLLHCRYDDTYIRAAKLATTEMFSRNKRTWAVCKNNVSKNALCFQRKFLEASCKIFPWSVMKIVRMGLGLFKPILEDRDLNVQIVYLVRDPRAVINSRVSSVKWCKTELCNDPVIHCKHMEEDYQALTEFSKLFPNRVHVIRYEDLALSPMNVTKDLLRKLNLDFDPQMGEFIKSHTTVDFDRPWSTSRESAKRVTHWVPKITQNTLERVQSACENIMPSFGYKLIQTTNNISIGDILQQKFSTKNY